MVWPVALKQADEAAHGRKIGVVVSPHVALAIGASQCNICVTVGDAQPVAAEMNSMEVCLQVSSSVDPHGPRGGDAPCRWRRLPTR